MRMIPRQTAGPTDNGFGFWFAEQSRILKWATYREARLAGDILGVPERGVGPITVIWPST